MEAMGLEQLSKEIQDLVSNAAGWIVQVSADGAAARTGVLLDERTVLTAARAADGGEAITVTTTDGTSLGATVKGFDGTLRLAVLELQAAAPAPSLPAEGEAAVGQFVVTVGVPGDAGVEVSLCIVRAVGGPMRLPGGRSVEAYIQLDAPAWPGFAGAPVLDARGRLVGIRALTKVAAAAYVIPTRHVLAAAGELREHGAPQWGYLGLRSQEVELPPDAETALERSQETGLLVVAVDEQTPAAAGGIRVGDIVVAIDGEPTETHDDLVRRLRGTAGTPIHVQVLRGGSRVTLDTTPTKRPDSGGRGRHHQRGHGSWHGRWKGCE